MSTDNLQLTIRESSTGKVAVINGKTYTLLRLYESDLVGGVFCLVVAGRTPLRPDDLDEHWRVLRSGSVYLALNARPFSYHLIAGDGTTTDAPDWPKLKASASYYAFVGPTEEALKTQIALTLERYHCRTTLDDALRHAYQVADECGGPPAYLIDAEDL